LESALTKGRTQAHELKAVGYRRITNGVFILPFNTAFQNVKEGGLSLHLFTLNREL